MTRTTIIAMATTACFAFGCLTAIVVTGHDASPLFGFILALIPLGAGQIVQLNNQGKMTDKLENIDKNVNGHMTKLIDAALPTDTKDKP